ncbi:MAG TPA: CoA transferase [Candidatus Binataceae bacterium]|nr:CoA transferase [Candidatus Binataceae bacterium]
MEHNGDRRQNSAEPKSGPLAGIRSVDCGMFAAGPYAAMLLSDLGAEVIKVEPPEGDTMRPTEKAFAGVQRGKRSMALDLKTPEGLQIFYQLAARADIVQHNLRLEVAERLGIGYGRVREVNPRIIYCHGTGFGSKGPLRRIGGFEMNYQAHGGLESAQAGEGNSPVLICGAPMDLFTAMQAASAILMALRWRDETGHGQYLEIPQFATAFVFESQQYLTPAGPGPRFTLDSQQTGLGPFYRIYETKDGRWICVSCPDQQSQERLLSALEIDPGARSRERAALAHEMEPRFRTRDADAWLQLLRSSGVPCEIAEETGHAEKILNDPQALERGRVVEYEHPVYGRLRQTGHLIRFSATPARIDRPPPLCGEHTREVMRELGYDAEQIAALESKNVIRCAQD